MNASSNYLTEEQYRQRIAAPAFGLKVGQAGIDPSFVRAAKGLIERLPDADKHAGGEMIYMSQGPDRDLYRTYARFLVSYFWNHSPFPDLYQQAFGLEPMLLVHFLTTRRHLENVSTTYVDWHMDANFYGYIVPMLTAWVPLDDVGVDAPGLEFLEIRNASVLELVKLWQGVHASVDEGAPIVIEDGALLNTLSAYETERLTPTLGPGGYLLFDQMQLHRTQLLERPKSRTAIEFRIASRRYRPRERRPEDIATMVVSTRDDGAVRIGFGRDLVPELAV